MICRETRVGRICCASVALQRAVEKVALPIIAIGGVDAANIPQVMHAGAHGIAVISAVCCREDPEGETRALYQALREDMPGERHG